MDNPGHRRFLRALIAAAAAGCCAVAVAVVLTRGGGSTAGATSTSATGLAGRFFSRYVQADGRVVRTDQGGDIVSEGEGYALLLADLTGRTSTARQVWAWTSAHMQRPDGLVSWHADATGHVLDPQSAADADVLLAYGLLDYRGPDSASMTTAGKRLAAAVLAHETVTIDGVPALVAGPWATDTSTVNPSYWMPSVFRELATQTHDVRWRSLADGSVRLLDLLTQHGKQLPPDWAQVTNGRLTAIGAPGTSGSPQYGLDAARVAVWLAIDCSSGAHTLAAAWWPRLRTDASAMTRTLDGSVVDGTKAPLPEVADAAAARAAGNDSATRVALANAARQAAAYPTYYGDAWAALGEALLARRPASC